MRANVIDNSNQRCDMKLRDLVKGDTACDKKIIQTDSYFVEEVDEKGEDPNNPTQNIDVLEVEIPPHK